MEKDERKKKEGEKEEASLVDLVYEDLEGEVQEPLRKRPRKDPRTIEEIQKENQDEEEEAKQRALEQKKKKEKELSTERQCPPGFDLDRSSSSFPLLSPFLLYY